MDKVNDGVATHPPQPLIRNKRKNQRENFSLRKNKKGKATRLSVKTIRSVTLTDTLWQKQNDNAIITKQKQNGNKYLTLKRNDTRGTRDDRHILLVSRE